MEILNIDYEMEMQKDPFVNDYLYEYWNGIYRCLHKCRCEIFNETTAISGNLNDLVD